MDHLFQIRSVGRPAEPMLEGWTALGFIGAHTKRARIGLMVGGIHYRDPGIWVKAATTLDVLTGGRAWLGLGAAWNEEESRGLGFDFPPLGERFELLEETLAIAHEMFEGELGSQRAFQGRHYQPTRLLNSPQSISRPRVPIMIGGGGEQKTLRLVAQYGDATNVFGGPEKIHHKYEVLRRHCEAVGRPFDEIERSTLQSGLRISRDGGAGTETPEQVIDRFGELGDAGAQHILFSVRDVWRTDQLELLGSTVLSQLRDA
jgi:F420-dependent oxidoreductase-like protein